MKILNMWKKIKEYYNEMDIYYGAGLNNKKNMKIGIFVMLLMSAFSLFQTFGSSIMN